MDLLEKGWEKKADLNVLGKLHEPILKLPGVLLSVKKVIKSVNGRDQTLLLEFTHERLLSSSFKARFSFPDERSS